MLGTDKYAYESKIKNMDPVDKLWISMGVLLLCIALNRWYISLFTFVSMLWLNAHFGKNKTRDIVHMLFVPFGFIIIGTITILISRFPSKEELLFGIKLGNYYYGATQAGLFQGFEIIAKSFGVIAAVYFMVMNTPMTDLSIAMERLHVPSLFTEIMELVYRFIFVLWDSSRRIAIAQNSRLGYKDLKTSYRSTGELGARLFVESLKRSDKIYNALESRGYQGKIQTIGMDYEKKKNINRWGIAIALVQIGLFIMIGAPWKM